MTVQRVVPKKIFWVYLSLGWHGPVSFRNEKQSKNWACAVHNFTLLVAARMPHCFVIRGTWSAAKNWQHLLQRTVFFWRSVRLITWILFRQLLCTARRGILSVDRDVCGENVSRILSQRDVLHATRTLIVTRGKGILRCLTMNAAKTLWITTTASLPITTLPTENCVVFSPPDKAWGHWGLPTFGFRKSYPRSVSR